MNFLKKYICELIFAINIFFIPFNHDFKIWWQRPVINDAMGYYVYLPATFIHHSFNYDFIYEPWKKHYQYAHNHPKGAFVVFAHGKELNKYPPGVAYYQMPFFLMAHAWTKITGGEADGYSDTYMYFLCIGAVFWQFIFFKILQKIFIFYNLSKTTFAISAPLLSFGTNLWFYTQIFGTYSHLYTLLSISLFFYAGLKFFDSQTANKTKYFSWMLVGFSIGLITRNINIIALLLLPCMGFQIKNCLSYFAVLKNKSAWIGLFLSLGLIFSMFIFWKIQTGHWMVDSYPDEHFNWAKPELLKNLFSPHKGWFFYTPLALLGLLGLFYTPKKTALNLLLVLALVVYLTSSWWCWDYGTAFSMRAYIDWYLIVSIGLGFLFERLIHKKTLLVALLSLCLFLTAINLLQSVQFMRGIISGSSQGIEYTMKNFFRLRPILEYPVSKNVTEASKLISNDFNDDKQRPYAVCNQENQFSKGLQLSMSDYLKGESYNHIRYGATIELNELNNQILLCVSVTDQKDSLLLWKQTEINRTVLANRRKSASAFTTRFKNCCVFLATQGKYRM